MEITIKMPESLEKAHRRIKELEALVKTMLQLNQRWSELGDNLSSENQALSTRVKILEVELALERIQVAGMRQRRSPSSART